MKRLIIWLVLGMLLGGLGQSIALLDLDSWQEKRRERRQERQLDRIEKQNKEILEKQEKPC